MPRYEVETDLLVHVLVKVTVEADSKDAALDAAADVMPHNTDRTAAKKWKAEVTLTPPKGANVQVVKAYHFEQASGGEKVRKLADAA